MFVDEMTIYAKAGDGGPGVVRWLRMKYKPNGGPAGGDGGNGGDVYLRAVKDLAKLAKYTGDKRFIAKNGAEGGNRSREGINGEDLFIDIPVGATVTNTDSGQSYELLHAGETVKILTGGMGGLGNERFKSSTNRTPEESTAGKPGEAGTFYIEISLLVDIGLVGLPNAGKSTLLNTLTNAKAAVGAYPFTTLEPHLGDCYGRTIADIPGLIEGAASGKGLGHKFLRHVSRTKMILHLVSLENENPYETYTQIRSELSDYSDTLTDKEEWVILTKTDLVSADTVVMQRTNFEEKGHTVYVISAETGEGIKELSDQITKNIPV